MAEFNLIDEAWIPCITLDGKSEELGIRDVLLRAHKLREICDDSPLVTVAIHRLLLAILYRAFQGPSGMSGWKKLYRPASFEDNSELAAYLKKWRDRFWLFHEHHPFMQVAGLDLNEYKADGTIKKDKSDGLMRLVREAPDKGGRVLFDHRVGTERPVYEPKQIARMILSSLAYAGTGIASGGKVNGQPISPTPCSFAPCVDGLCLWPQGENLFQTILLNMVPIDLASNDLPAWEVSCIIDSAKQSWQTPVASAGPVQRFAAMSRFIRVLDRQSMFYTNGLKTAVPDNDDPMKAYSRSDDTAAFDAVRLREDKAAWRDAHSLFSLASTTRKPPAALNHIARILHDGTLPRAMRPRANVVGLATDKGKALLWRHERIPVPTGILGSDDLTEWLAALVSGAEAVGSALSRGLFWSATNKKTIRTEPVGRIQLIADLVLAPTLEVRGDGIVRTSTGRAPDDAHNASALSLSENVDPRPAYWSRLEKHFFDLLENLPKDWDAGAGEWKPDDQQAATRAWREAVKREAKLALDESIRSLGTTARAIAAVARVRTTFNDDDLKPQPRKKAASKPRAKAGGKEGRKK
ncbi:MAG: type I-E CRISPR-associated protein Cse1/CasA [Phycisphaeraceae bacterium]|nr:type I-E CRISPR-associated protein Cse1/CasA [Phycisphaeraceae bacterium]